MKAPAPTPLDTELDSIRAQLLHLEYLDTQTDQLRRALQARRAQLLEKENGYALS